jgi:hypothetical protein
VLDIKIRALLEGIENVTALSNEIRATGDAATEAGAQAQAGAAGVNAIKTEISALTDPIGYLKENLGSLISAFTALTVAYGLKESADYAARTEVLGTTLAVVAKNAGYTTEQISGYEQEVEKLGITTQATREALTQMIQAGIALGPAEAGAVSQVAQLARAAQDLAVVTGENSSATLTRLITNISQLDTMGLRYMGLLVNVQQAEDKFAASLGKTADQLTQTQKVQAVTNEALVQAAKLNGAYEASMQDVGKQLQSIKRYQEDLANDIGSQLLPAYYQLVAAATDFLKQTDAVVKGTDQSGQGAHALADGVRDFFGAVDQSGVELVRIFTEVQVPLEELTGQLLSLLGQVVTGAVDVLTFGGSFDTASGKVSILGAALSVVVNTVSLFVASFRDGLSIVTVAVQGFVAVALATLGILTEGIGKVIGTFNKSWGDAITEAGKAMIGTANEIADNAANTVNAFGRGESAVGKFSKALQDAQVIAKALNGATNYSDIEAQIIKLTAAQRDNTQTDVELQKNAGLIADAIKRLGGEVDTTTGKFKLTTAEVTKLNNELNNVTKDSIARFQTDITNLGDKVHTFGGTDYLTPLNAQFEKTAGAIQELASNATATSLIFREAFNNGLNSAKTVSDLVTLNASLHDAQVAGKDLGSTTTDLRGRFDDLLASELKAAHTSEDFQALRAQIVELGDKGGISLTQMKIAQDQITEAITQSNAQLLLEGKNTAAAADEAVNLAKSHLAVATADYNVSKARLDVWKANNQYELDGSNLSQQKLAYAQLELAVAKSQADDARLAYQVETAHRQEILTLQNQELAVIKLKVAIQSGADATDQEQALANAKAAVQQAQLSYDLAKETADKHQEDTEALQEVALKQKAVVDQAQALSDQQTAANKALGDYNTGLSRSSSSLAAATANAGNLNKGMLAVAGAASQFANNLEGATAEQLKLQAAITATDAAQQRLDALQGNGGGAVQFGEVSTAGAGSAPSGDRTDGGSANNLTPVNTAFDIQDKLHAGTLTADDLADAQTAVQQATTASKLSYYFETQNAKSLGDDGTGALLTNANQALRQVQAIIDAQNKKASAAAAAPDTSPDLSAQALAQVAAVAPTSAIASPDTSTAQAAASTQAPSKIIQVNFTTNGGAAVPLTLDASNETALLALLAQAKGISS